MNLKDVKPLDLQDILDKGNLKNRVALLGVELEGGWRTLPKGVALVHDGSVAIPNPPESVDLVTGRLKWRLNLGELPSTPMTVADTPAWMRKYYPSHVNQTCGLHVHMSFTTALHYSWLMVPAFPASVLKYVAVWAEKEGLKGDHPIWGRLKGINTACQHLFHADLQVSQPQKGHDRAAFGHRYTVVGYPWPRHTTIEHRILPGFEDKEQAIRAVKCLVDITNASLLVLGRKEKKLEASILSQSGSSTTSTFRNGVEVSNEMGIGLDDLLREEMRVEA